MEEQVKRIKKEKETKQITSEQYRKLFLFLSFFVPFEMMLLAFARSIIYPFGEESFLVSDLYHQYFPIFQEFVNKIRSGKGILYTWNMGLGMNFYVVYANNLASPLNWLAFLVPDSHLLEFVTYQVTVKVGLAGLTSYLLFVNRNKEDRSTRTAFFALVFSFCYAMSGYVAAYNNTIMWLDCIFLAPLVLIGLERLVKDGKMGIYVASLAACIITNFYIAFLICIFLVLYFAILFVTEKREKGCFLKFSLGSLLAGGLSSFIVIPIAVFMMNSNFEQAQFPKKIEFYFSVFEEFARHCMMIRPSAAEGHWPNVYCGVAVFLFLPLYVINRSIPLKKKVLSLALAAFFLLSFMTNSLDYIWHGMNYPAGFPARQSFLYILLLLSMGYDCFVSIDHLCVKKVLISYGIGAGFIVLTRLFFQNEDFYKEAFPLTLLFVTAYAVSLSINLIKDSQKVKERLAIICYVLIVAECTYNMGETSLKTTPREEYLEDISDYRALYDRNKDYSDGFQRFESSDTMTEDDSALYGYPSGSVFASMLNTDMAEFYGRIGMPHGKVYYDNNNASPLTSALLNVGHLFSGSDNDENEMWSIEDKEDNIYLYEAVYTLPFGYVSPKGFDLESQGDAIEQQNALIRKLGIGEKLFEKEFAGGTDAGIEFTSSQSGRYYAVLHNANVTSVVLDVQDGGGCYYDHLKENYLLDLGNIKSGQKAYLRAGSDDEKIDASIYRLNPDVLGEALGRLQREHMTNVEIKDNRVLGKLYLGEAGRLVLSVPYDQGWTVTINGVQRKPETFGGALMAFDLEPGSYEIEMHYFPLGLKLGIGISLFFLLIFALLIFCGKRKAIVHFS